MDNKGLEQVAQSSYITPRARRLHDPAVTFEEYQYYARRTREVERHLESPKLRWRQIISSRTSKDAAQGGADADADDKVLQVNFANEDYRLQITDEEWTNANRALRTASCSSSFLLLSFPTYFHLMWCSGKYLKKYASSEYLRAYLSHRKSYADNKIVKGVPPSTSSPPTFSALTASASPWGPLAGVPA